jgi:Ca2+-binding RTX toxin-like protein
MATFNGTEGNDTITGGADNDVINGNGGNDSLLGGDGSDTVSGGAGNDFLSGNAGADWVEGGTGNDEVRGGSGQDSIAFHEFGAANADILSDFDAGWDNIQLDASAFTQIGAAGRMSAGDARFFSGAAAHDADDRIIYNSATGQLFYDADGNGAGAAQLIATISNHSALSATDLWVFGSAPTGGTINGTAGDDSLNGTSGNDTVNGFAGNDTLNGGDGDDSILGGDGGDNISGGPGNDYLDGGNDGDTIYGEQGNDTLLGGAGNDNLTIINWGWSVTSNAGNDVVDGGAGFDRLTFSIGDAFSSDAVTLDMATGTYSIAGAGGSGTFTNIEGVQGSFYNDRLSGTEAADEIGGSFGDDTILGLGGNDTLYGGGGNDSVLGGAGDDVINSGGGAAGYFDGGDGNDSIGLNNGNDTVLGGAGDDSMEISFLAVGGSSDYGTKVIDGGAGVDTLSFSETRSAVVVNLETGTLTGGGSNAAGSAGSASLTSIENFDVSNSGRDNQITGSSVANILHGGSGADTIDGLAGNDTLTGGAGADTFQFSVAPGAANADLISDFVSGSDTVLLESAAFSNAGTAGRFVAGDVRFYAAAGATAGHDADDRVVYDTSTGNLWYDADGSGAGASQLIGTLQGAPSLTATDIAVDNATLTPTPSTITGTSGNDTLTGTSGPDTINGLGGDDSLIGAGGADSLIGGDGNDTLDGWNSRTFNSDLDVDTMDGGAGNDTFMVDNVNDVLIDSGGVDTVFSHDVSWTLAPGFENLTLRQDNDTAIHGTGNDQDNLIQANWFSVLDGRGGNDTILGSVQNDTLLGGDGNDSIVSGGDFDSIDGGAGDDTIDGGESDITGGAGADHFVLSLSTTNGIHDVLGGTDKLRLDGARFANVGASGNFAAGDERFYADLGASSAHDASDRVIYNTATGELFYDADGTGTSSAPVRLGVFQGLSATDIEVVNGTTPTPTPTGSSFPPASITGTSGNDNLAGTGGNDTIYGLAGNDTIFANSGNDWVVGGTGNDSLSGGSGQDTYGFGESGAANADIVGNFDSNWDAIALDAGGFSNIGTTGRFAGGDVRFFAGAGATSGHDADDRIVYNTTTGQLFYDADGSGSGASQLIATFTGHPGIAATDITVYASASPSPTPTPSSTPTEGDDRIVGTNGNDSLVGLGGNDTLVGLAGNDTLDGGTGADSMDGGAGDDLYIVDNSGDTIFEAQNEGIDEVRTSLDFYQLPNFVNNLTLTGTANSVGFGNDIENVLTGNAGNNQFQGAGGNDTINGGAGNDTIFGQGGDDVLNGGTGNDYMEGGDADRDTYVFDAAPGVANADTIGGFASGTEHIVLDGTAFTNIGASGNFAAGDARFYAAAGATQGHDADDRIIFDTSSGRLYYDADGSGSGASQLFATLITVGNNPPLPGTIAAGDFVVVNGSTTPPSMTPTDGDDSLTGTAGNDSIDGLGGNDTINGLGGNDSLTGGAGLDSLIGGDGNDTLDGSSIAPMGGFAMEPDTLDGGAGNDTYIVDANDLIVADPGGTDSVVAWDTSWTLGAGLDNLTLRQTARVDGSSATGNELNNIIDVSTLDHSGAVHGMAGNDTIFGGQHSGALFGDDGNDVLHGEVTTSLSGLDGGAGDDTLIAGSTGSMTGGTGADRFVFLHTTGNNVTDFASGVDKLHLDANDMTALGTTGNFAAGDVRFYAAAGATGGHDADDRVVYDTSSGRLYFDDDGNGSDTARLIATLMGAPSISATDITVDNGSTPTPTPGQNIIGTSGNDTLVAGAGNDTIFGNSGNDWIEGRGGNDQLSGGSGQDSYVFREFGASNADTLLQFDSNWDAMRFDSGAFTALGGPGHFSSGDARFYSAAGANGGHDADDRIVYNTSTGQLYYDADGAGGADAQLVATVQGAGAVAASDIWVV